MIDVKVVSRFATDRRVWRSFDHLLAAGPGTLLCVPVGLADGDLTSVVDGCPVPWPEVWAVLDAPTQRSTAVLGEEELYRCAPLAAVSFAPFGWVRDVVPAQATVPTITRLTAPDGVRLALLGGNHD